MRRARPWWGVPASSTLGGLLRIVWPNGPGQLVAVPTASGHWEVVSGWRALPGDDAERREHPNEGAGVRCWLHQGPLPECGCPTIQECLRPTMSQKLGVTLPVYGEVGMVRELKEAGDADA